MVLCDVSFEMLRIASVNHTSSNLYGVVACDSTHLPFRKSQFPTITSFTVLQNIEETAHAVKEAFRVNSKEGIFGVSILKKGINKLKFAELLGKYFQEIKPVSYKEIWEDFQKMGFQSDKYSQFYDPVKVEDFFLIAKKCLEDYL